MKIIHISDTHLWLWIENTPREYDFYNNFEYVIDEIIKINPDFVIHTWDLFHTPKPSNKAISIVVQNLLKLSQKNIKTIIIAWNHDTPRLSTTTHSFEIFKSIKNIFLVYEPNLENIEFSDINFVCLPHIHDEKIFKENIIQSNKYINKKKINIFLSHFWISARDYEEYSDEISWISIKKEELDVLWEFDYVALWHYHKNFCIWNMCYPWSIEHTSFNQKNYNIWYNEVILKKGSKIKIKKHYLNCRNMIDLWDIDCNNIKSTDDLVEIIENIKKETNIKWSILKVSFINIWDELLLDFNDLKIKKSLEEAMYFEYKKTKKIKQNYEWNLKIKQSNIIKDNFEEFFSNYKFENNEIDKETLKKELFDLIKNT